MKSMLVIFFFLLLYPHDIATMFGYRNRASSPQLNTHFSAQLGVIKRIIHTDSIKGFYRKLMPSARHLSPIHGIGLIEGNFLKNLYKFGNKDDATTQLVADQKYGIFHLRGGIVWPTRKKSNPGCSLSPEVLGAIIGSLEKGILSTSKSEIVSAIRQSHYQKTGSAISSTKVNMLMGLIEDSANECDRNNKKSTYLPGTTQQILLAYLYKKSNDKSDMIRYLKSLEKYISVTFGASEYAALLHDSYTSDALSEDVPLNTSLLQDRYEQVIYRFLKAKDLNPIYPKLVEQSLYSYKTQPLVADCMESSMRSVCNVLLSDTTSSFFNLDILPKNLKLHPSLKKFYTDFNSFEVINNEAAGQAWMNMVSDIEGMVYKHQNYELRAHERNVIPLCNHLFGTTAETLCELSEQLSDERRIVQCIKIDLSSLNTNIRFVVTYTHSSREVAIDLYVGNKMEDLLCASTCYPFYPSGWGHERLESFCRDLAMAHIHDKQTARSLLSLVGSPKIDVANSSIDSIAQALFSTNLTTDDQKLEILSSLLSTQQVAKSPQLLAIMANIVDSLPESDEICSRMVDIIRANRLDQIDAYFASYLNSVEFWLR
jgi:hypothetical protein